MAVRTGLRRLDWRSVGAGVGVVVLVLLLAPHWFYLEFFWGQVAIPAAAIGYLSRRSVLDGILFAAAHFACAIWVEAPVATNVRLRDDHSMLLPVFAGPRTYCVELIGAPSTLIVTMRPASRKRCGLPETSNVSL